ncbi:threonine/serine exporter family protein [Nostocoides sp. F2B08]|uniref:threonine/serine ThrE exporter family protein n=1 Tax=Nostocoides sp. F2B08 TaxID=2653936 RepID=UPI001263C63B|nr:threonine/serine exporter family protein [Tetrasphaera sp. F2B08]KAB7742377.1 threonine/serine exporter family protein [Tetrasphaera sp. F2B08]
MSERREVRKSFDLALRIGEMLLVSGSAASDVTEAMLAVTRACGLHNVSADVTFIDLTLRHQLNVEEPLAIQVRRVARRPVNYAELMDADQIMRELVSGDLTRDQARDRVARVVSAGRRRRPWARTLGWGVMGTGVALTLGGDALVCLLAFAAAVAIDRTQFLLPLGRIPTFYQQAAGGFLATLIAVTASATQLEANPSRVVTAGIVMLLAGVGITGATQDALTGFPVTATARLLDALLNTAGIIAGVGAGLTFGGLFTVELGTFTYGAAGLAAAGVTVVGAALAAVGFAVAASAPLRALVVVALVAGLGQAVLLGIDAVTLGRTWGAATAAVAIGAISFVVSARFRVPPLVVIVPAIVPLLPGLDIYRGLALFAAGEDGVLQLASAFATALAVAAGVTLGQYLAQPSSARRAA